MVIRKQSPQNSAAPGRWSLNEESGPGQPMKYLGGGSLEPSHGVLSLQRSLRTGPQEGGALGGGSWEREACTRAAVITHSHNHQQFLPISDASCRCHAEWDQRVP